MADPSRDALTNVAHRRTALPIGSGEFPEALPGAGYTPPQQAPVIREHEESKEGNPVSRAVDDALAGMQAESKAPRVPRQLVPKLLQLRAIVTEDDEVVAVPNVRRAAKAFLHEVVQRVQVDIREELARQVPDWQPPRARRGKQVVAREVRHVVLPAEHFLAALQDPSDQVQHPAIGDDAGHQAEQHLVVDARKVLHNVRLEDI
jgi:hypothetical protein